jgi:hypothetical protein
MKNLKMLFVGLTFMAVFYIILTSFAQQTIQNQGDPSEIEVDRRID